MSDHLCLCGRYLGGPRQPRELPRSDRGRHGSSHWLVGQLPANLELSGCHECGMRSPLPTTQPASQASTSQEEGREKKHAPRRSSKQASRRTSLLSHNKSKKGRLHHLHQVIWQSCFFSNHVAKNKT